MPHDEATKKKKSLRQWDTHGGPVTKTYLGLGSIPGQATKCHIWQLKILSAATKTWYSQVDYVCVCVCVCVCV